MGPDQRPAREQSRSRIQDHLRVPTAQLRRQIPGWSVKIAAKADQTVASAGGARQGGVLPSDPLSGHSVRLRLYHMGDLEIAIRGELLEHLLYHFVLTYCNWE